MITIGIVGATGLVGRELVAILQERGWPVTDLRPYASSERAVEIHGHKYVVRQPVLSDLLCCDVVFFSATAATAKEYAVPLAEGGVLVVDNSSAFRHSRRAALVIPEVNASDLGNAKLIANPNCSTILLLLAVAPLNAAFGCDSVNVSTYQAVSGAGAAAVDKLRDHTRTYLNTGRLQDFAFNVWSHESSVDIDTGLNTEEQKLISETRRILGDRPRVSPTCVRVPVERVHGESVTVYLERRTTEGEVRRVLAAAPGLRLEDDRRRAAFPTAHSAVGQDEVMVGRIRENPATAGTELDGRSYQFWLTGDQLRKGAALNAVQIAEQHPSVRGLIGFTWRQTPGSPRMPVASP